MWGFVTRTQMTFSLKIQGFQGVWVCRAVVCALFFVGLEVSAADDLDLGDVTETHVMVPMLRAHFKA